MENEVEATASCRKAFDLCAMAATRISNTGNLPRVFFMLSPDDKTGWHVTSILAVMQYKENFCLRRSPAFLTYYVFSAGCVV